MNNVATPQIPPQTVQLWDKDGEPVWVVISGTLKDGLFIDLSTPTTAQVGVYLRLKGYRRWKKAPGAMWNVNGHPIGVPDRDGDPYATEGAVVRIADAEGRPRHEVAAEMVALDVVTVPAGDAQEQPDG